MKRRDILVLLVLGVAIWIVGTIGYAYAAPALLQTSLRYRITFVASPVLSCAICVWILWRRAIPRASWATAMLLLAIPGMIGEAAVLTHLSVFMPNLPAASGGNYGALLFATYAAALGVAEIVTLKARC